MRIRILVAHPRALYAKKWGARPPIFQSYAFVALVSVVNGLHAVFLTYAVFYDCFDQ